MNRSLIKFMFFYHFICRGILIFTVLFNNFFSYAGCCSKMCGCFCPCFKKNGYDISNTGNQNNNIQNPIINNQNNNTQNIDHKNDEIINEPDTKIIDSEDEFKSDFNNEFTTFISNFSEEVKNKCTDNNIPDYVLGDYWNMYQQMISEEEIFTHEAAMSLLCYRELLRICGIVDVLKELFKDKNRVTWWPGMMDTRLIQYRLFYFSKPNNEESGSKIMFRNNEEKNKDGKLVHNYYKLGGIYIDNILFKGLRCSGNPCNNADCCVSCLLRDLLDKEGLYGKKENEKETNLEYEKYTYGKFFNIYCEQAEFSFLSRGIKKLISKSVKNKYKIDDEWNSYNGKFTFFLLNEEYEAENGEETIMLDKDTQKSIMIEWALTVEFLKYFLPVMSKDKKSTLYRTIHKNQYENEDYGNKRDLFESTSIFGPVYEHGSKIELVFIYFDDVPLYRCIFNYVISPCEYGMFGMFEGGDLDYEQEIGCITKGLEVKKLTYHCEENINDLYKHYVGRCMFLKDEFIKTLKMNFKKFGYCKDAKKIIFPKLSLRGVQGRLEETDITI